MSAPFTPRLIPLVLVLSLLAAATSWASRRYISLDQAIESSTVIISGNGRTLNADALLGDGPQLYEITVAQCWKGGLKPGDKVVCVDWIPNSSASWSFADAGSNLVFLAPIDADERDVSKLPGKPETYFDVVDLKRLVDRTKQIEAATTERDRAAMVEWGQTEKKIWNATERLLTILLVEKPQDLAAAWRKILADESNPYLLQYAAEHLPQPLSSADANQIAQAILRHPTDRDAVWQMLRPLAAAKHVFSPDQLQTLITAGAPLSSGIAGFINASNIAPLQEALFARLTRSKDADYADSGILEQMARLSPDFARQQLRAGPREFEIEIPLLRALGTNASAFGRADYADAMLNANAAITRRIGKAIRNPDEPFSLQFDMTRLFEPGGWRDDWFALGPLMSPLLTTPDPLRRAQAAAFLRTMGYTVDRIDGTYQLDPKPAGVPIELRIQPPAGPITIGQPWSLQYRRTASVDAITLTRKPNTLIWRVARTDAADNSAVEVHTSTGGWNWRTTDATQFVTLGKGKLVDETYTFDAKLVPAPGRYRVSLVVVYEDDGEKASEHAWTGALRADPIEVEFVAK